MIEQVLSGRVPGTDYGTQCWIAETLGLTEVLQAVHEQMFAEALSGELLAEIRETHNLKTH